ncbi:probable glutamate receptor [Procambarus clarkii]|uniref:probable glutamate receptor n=1 Tax=Procambarus clarkii TaxID=6728 RepID=UPI003742111D
MYTSRFLAVTPAMGVVVTETGAASADGVTEKEYDNLKQELWGDLTLACQALVVDNTSSSSKHNSTVRFLEWYGLWTRPHARLLILGDEAGVKTFFRHHVLRNTIHALYLALDNPAFRALTLDTRERDGEGVSVVSEAVGVYRRCLYCDNGQADSSLLHRWSLHSQVPRDLHLFQEDPDDFMGHKFMLTAKNYFPYFSFQRASEDPDDTKVFPLDSLNTRMIYTLSSLLNFTYEIREPADRQWGVPSAGGNFTGMVGDLQSQRADFSLDLTLIPQRVAVIEFCRVYIDESVVIISSKPRPLPEYLSLVRPFEGELWLTLLASICVWGVTQWLLQKAWARVSGGSSLTLGAALMYSWGAILGYPPPHLPHNITGKVMVGCWLVLCLTMTCAYSSSLVSHLVVQGKSPLINSIQELVAKSGWRWGTPRMTGALLIFLNTSQDPAVQKLYYNMQADSMEKGMELVLKGDYAFIYSKYYSRTLVATNYTDEFGYTPIHISSEEYPLFAGNAWGFRTGAPFRRLLSLSIQRLLEAGLITFWMNDVISVYVREARTQKVAREARGQQARLMYKGAEGKVVLGLVHLQVTFYLLLFSYSLGLFIFLLELLLKW